MIIDHCIQGSVEWEIARAGIPSASEFGKILTPTGRKSAQANDYMNLCVAEWLRGVPKANKTYGWMDHGSETEEQARDTYEFMTGHSVVEIGFVYKDEDKLVGCSPDGMLCDIRRGLEVKCPSPEVHIGYMLCETLPAIYIPQVQGSMSVTGYKEWDFMSFHPDYPPMIITVKRDEDYIKELDKLMQPFLKTMAQKRNQLREYRH